MTLYGLVMKEMDDLANPVLVKNTLLRQIQES